MTINDSAEGTGITGPAYWGFWGTVLWGTLVAFVFIVLQTIMIIAILLARGTPHSSSLFVHSLAAAATDGYILSVVTFATTIICTSLVTVIIKLKKNSVLQEYLCLRPVPLIIMLKWVAVLAVFIALANAISVAIGRPIVSDFMTAIYATANPVWLLWLALIFVAPLFEEVFFRGFLFQGFASGFLGTTGTVFVTSGLWAVIHTQYDTYDKVVIFCLGLVLGTARVHTRSLLAPYGLHALTNLEATLEAAWLG